MMLAVLLNRKRKGLGDSHLLLHTGGEDALKILSPAHLRAIFHFCESVSEKIKCSINPNSFQRIKQECSVKNNLVQDQKSQNISKIPILITISIYNTYIQSTSFSSSAVKIVKYQLMLGKTVRDNEWYKLESLCQHQHFW